MRTMRAAFEYAVEFARTEKKLGTTPIIEHQNVGFMLADVKMRIDACRYLTWKACHDFERTAGRAQELAIMTKVEGAVRPSRRRDAIGAGFAAPSAAGSAAPRLHRAGPSAARRTSGNR